MALLPKVKLKAVVSFPATVLDGAGIDVVKANGSYQFNLDFGDFAPPVTGLSDSTHQNALLWNNISNVYTLANIALLGGSSGIPDAPVDGALYGRKNAVWTAVPASTTTPGGSANSIQYNNSGAFGGISLTTGQMLVGSSTAPIAALPPLVDVVAAYGIDNTGAVDIHTVLQTALNAANTAGVSVYIRGGTYNMGSSQLTVPDGLTVICDQHAILQRTVDPANWATPAAGYSVYTGALVSAGNRCRWSGGTLNNTAILGTSSTSNTMGTGGTKTFTTAAGLTIAAGNFIRVWSTASPQMHFEGTVNSYSGTTLVLNAQFAGGSGTAADWKIAAGAVYQCALVLHGTTESTIDNVRITGNWYVGMLMDGWNPSTGGSLTVTYCTFRDCFAESVLNRGFYIYGNCNDNLIDGCFVNGGSGTTDYGFNTNPANATGTVNSQIRNKMTNSTVNGAAFQGFEIGDQCVYTIISECTANNLTDSSGVGFLIQAANNISPAYNRILGCIASNCSGFGFEALGVLYGGMESCIAIVCGQGFYVGPSGSVQTTELSINNSEANNCITNGFHVAGNCQRCDLNSLKAVNNGTGVIIDAGAVRTLATGRAFGNTTAQLLDSGTSSVVTGLTTV